MAIEMANILRSLNAMLESKERRQRFDVEAALSGMEVAMKREQQRIGERQFKDEMRFKEKGLRLEEKQVDAVLGEKFRQEIGALKLEVETAKIKKASSVWGGYLSGVADEYFRQTTSGKKDYKSSERNKLIKALTNDTGDRGAAERLTNLIIRYETSVDAGKGNTQHMLGIARILGDKMQLVDGKPRDIRFAKGILKFLNIDDAYDSSLMSEDFNDLLDYEVTGEKLGMELLEIAKGDYEYTTGAYEDIFVHWDEDKAETGYEMVGGRRVSTQDLKDYAIENKITIEQARNDLIEFNADKFLIDPRLKALKDIEALSGQERLKAIATELSGYEEFGITGYDPTQGFFLEGGELGDDSEGRFEKDWMQSQGVYGQTKDVRNRERQVAKEIEVTRSAIRKLERSIEDRKRMAAVTGAPINKESQMEDEFNISVSRLATEAYEHQRQKLMQMQGALEALGEAAVKTRWDDKPWSSLMKGTRGL